MRYKLSETCIFIASIIPSVVLNKADVVPNLVMISSIYQQESSKVRYYCREMQPPTPSGSLPLCCPIISYSLVSLLILVPQFQSSLSPQSSIHIVS